MPIIPTSEWPEPLSKYPQLKGIFVGGCVERGDGSSFRAKAHSHCDKLDQYKGWICIRRLDRLKCKPLMLHELAHLISEAGHTDKWRKVVLQIGGTLDAVPGIMGDCHKRSRMYNRLDI